MSVQCNPNSHEAVIQIYQLYYKRPSQQNIDTYYKRQVSFIYTRFVLNIFRCSAYLTKCNGTNVRISVTGIFSSYFCHKKTADSEEEDELRDA